MFALFKKLFNTFMWSLEYSRYEKKYWKDGKWHK